MRYVTIGLALAISAMLIGCATSEQALEPEKGTTETAYEVYGMDCPGCHGGFEKNLVKIPGVEKASANWKRKTVTLLVSEGNSVEREEILKAAEDSNFTLGERVR